MADTLAVINTAGQVWARDISATTVGTGVQLRGPGLFGDHDDKFVVASGMTQRSSTTAATTIGVIGVITASSFWPRQADDQNIGAASQISGNVLYGSDTKYVVFFPDIGAESFVFSLFFSVNTKGEVGAQYYYTGQDSITDPLTGNVPSGNPFKLNGPLLSGFPDDKYVVLWYNNIFVINKVGEVWAHQLSNSRDPNSQQFDTVSAGVKLNGGLFGAPDDKYVVVLNGTLYVINNAGQVWAHTVSYPNIADGVQLKGPGLFGGPDDKYVVTYSFTSQ